MKKVIISLALVAILVLGGIGGVKVKANFDKVNKVNEVVKEEMTKMMKEYGLQQDLDTDVHELIKDSALTDILNDSDIQDLVNAVSKTVDRLKMGTTVTTADLVKIQEKIALAVKERGNGLSEADIKDLTNNLQTVVLSAIDGEYATTTTAEALAAKITTLQLAVDAKNTELQKAISKYMENLCGFLKWTNASLT